MALNLTCAKLKLQDDFDKWIQGEWNQLDKYELQDKIGDPIPWPDRATVLPFVWTYVLKQCPITGQMINKARATCNGCPRYGRAVTMAETYVTCVKQPACRMYWSLTASNNLIAMGADAGNAFAEAPPLQKFFMRIDEQFRHWWTLCKGRAPIPKHHILPVNNALQGHPESPRLWEQHIHKIIVTSLRFQATTHEKCLCSRQHPETLQLELLLRQVDNFSVSADTPASCMHIIAEIGKHLKAPLNDLGIIRKFNGTNILQTRWYIKVSCEDYYLQKILTQHDWLHLKASNQPLPMRSDSKHQRQLELVTRPQTPEEQQYVQAQAGFSYRNSIWELIYALVIARPDISLATTKLSQYSTNPALEHYHAVKAVFAFLNNTKDNGLIFWRNEPRLDLPHAQIPSPYSSQHNALVPSHLNHMFHLVSRIRTGVRIFLIAAQLAA